MNLEGVHEGEREATLEAIGEQASELYGKPEPSVTCPCGLTGPLPRMFRCFYCEVWFCPRHAEQHFEGEHPEVPAMPMDLIEAEAADLLTEPPVFDLISIHDEIGAIPDRAVPVDGLREELEIVEEAAHDEYERGNITRHTRLGILVVVAGLRDTLDKSEEAA